MQLSLTKTTPAVLPATSNNPTMAVLDRTHLGLWATVALSTALQFVGWLAGIHSAPQLSGWMSVVASEYPWVQ